MITGIPPVSSIRIIIDVLERGRPLTMFISFSTLLIVDATVHVFFKEFSSRRPAIIKMQPSNKRVLVSLFLATNSGKYAHRVRGVQEAG